MVQCKLKKIVQAEVSFAVDWWRRLTSAEGLGEMGIGYSECVFMHSFLNVKCLVWSMQN